MVFLDQPDQLVQTKVFGDWVVKLRAAISATVSGLAFWFIVPTAAVILSLLAQQAITFAPSKLATLVANFTYRQRPQKYGRTGLTEFAKSFVKLVLFSACLAVFLQTNLPEILVLAGADRLSTCNGPILASISGVGHRSRARDRCGRCRVAIYGPAPPQPDNPPKYPG